MAKKSKHGGGKPPYFGNSQKGQVQSILSSLPNMDDFINSVSAAAEQNEALPLVREQAGHLFDMAKGEEINRLESERTDYETQRKQSARAIEEQHRLLINTSPTIKSSQFFKEESPQQDLFGGTSTYHLMPLKDKVVATLCVMLGAIVVGMGACNVYSTVMAAGIPVFLDQPFMAVMLAALVPIGSVALKFFVHYLPHDKARRFYHYAIYLAASVAILAWVVQFAQTFGAASSGIDWTRFASDAATSEGNGANFVITQLLADILVGATLFLVASDILLLYDPLAVIINPAYEAQKHALQRLREDHKILAQKDTEARSQLEALYAARKAYINLQISRYLKRAAQFSEK